MATATEHRHRLITDENSRWWTLGAMCFALFMLMLDNTVVNVALPSIQRDLHASLSSLEWTVNAYTLTLAVLMITSGRLADIFGRRRLFLIGVSVFGIASLVIGFSPNDTVLIAFRAVQGIGAACMMPASLAIITQAFPPHQRGMAIGTWAGVSALALAIGPVLGGFLTEDVSWRAIFFINPPIAVIAVAVTLFAAHESRDETVDRTVDYRGIVLLTIGLTALVLSLIEGNSWHWGSPRIIALWIIAAVALVRVLRDRGAGASADARPQLLPQPHVGRREPRRLHRQLRAVRAVLLPDALHAERDAPLATADRRPLPADDRRARGHGPRVGPADRQDRTAATDGGRAR